MKPSKDNTKRTTEQFLAEAHLVHQGAYDYSKSIYKNANTKLIIICPVHGEFEQQPASHLKGMGCRKCAAKKRASTYRLTADDFIRRATETHQGKYTYENFVYQGYDSKSWVTCPDHGDFKQTPHLHLQGSGCSQCRSDQVKDWVSISFAEFVARAKETHGDSYSYLEATYTNASSKTTITCPKHGDFDQVARFHYQGQGCPKCGTDRSAESVRSNSKVFIEKARSVHGDFYDYRSSDYTLSTDPLTILCPSHGTFQQKPNDHLDGHGCPSCGIGKSSLEERLYEALLPFIPDLTRRDRSGVAGFGSKQPLELDLYSSSLKLGIEVQGLLWHSSYVRDKKGEEWVQKHQQQKLENSLTTGITLLTLYEDEISDHFELVLGLIKAKAGILPAIYARKTEVKDLPWNEAKEFFTRNHLQGAPKPSKVKGLYYQGQLVAAMAFDTVRSVRGQKQEGVYELIRYASRGRIVGGCSKLLKSFTDETPNLEQVISYSDRRISEGQLYEALDFELEHTTPPDYQYVWRNKRYHKSNFTRKRLEQQFSEFDPNLTEYENCQTLKIFRLYNCGLHKWIKYF